MRLDRRHFLATASLAAGGPFFAPMIAKLRAEAAGVAPPKRFVFVVEGNGLPWHQIQPKGIERKEALGQTALRDRDAFRSIPLADHDLPPALAPVAEFKDRLTVIQGLSGKMNVGGHSSDYGALGAFNGRGTVGAHAAVRGETIDYTLGRALGGPFPHVGLGIVHDPDAVMVNNVTAAGPDAAVPTVCRPDLAYQNLFGWAVGDRKAFDTRKCLLDHLTGDVKRAEAELTGAERAKLQSYLHAFESMRGRHERLVAMEAVVRKNAPPITDKFKSAVETDRLDAHFDLATASLVAGLTNVVTIASGAGTNYFNVKFTGLGINMGKHAIGHGGGDGDRTWDDLSTAIRKFHFEMIARLVGKLKAVNEGGGTMLDNTCIVYLSDAAEGHHSRCTEWPMVLLGNLGGKLKAGRYVEFPGYAAAGHRQIGNLYTTLLHAAGHPRDSFGTPDLKLGREIDQKGPLSELLT